MQFKKFLLLSLCSLWTLPALADHSEWHNARIVGANLHIPDIGRTTEGAQCAIKKNVNYDGTYFDYVIGLKPAQTIDLSAVSILMDHKRVKDRTDEWGRKYTDVDWSVIESKFDQLTSLAAASGCQLLVSSASDEEFVLPSEEKKAWSGSIAADAISGAYGEKLRTNGAISKVRCECLSGTSDPAKDSSHAKKIAMDTHALQLKNLKVVAEESYSKLDKTFKDLKANLTHFKTTYADLEATLQASEIASDLNAEITAAQLLGYYRKLEPQYNKLCPASIYSDEVALVNKIVRGIQAEVASRRVLFSSRSGSLPDFWATWKPTKQLISEAQSATPAYEEDINLMITQCDAWDIRIKAIVERIRYERTRAALEDFKKLEASLVQTLQDQANALARYDHKLYWTYLLQEKIEVFTQAKAEYRFTDTEQAAKDLLTFYGLLKKRYMTNVNAFSEDQKTELLAEFQARIQAQTLDWANLKNERGFNGTLAIRTTQFLNAIWLKKAKSKLGQLEAAKAEELYGEIRTHLTAGLFKIAPACESYAEAKAKPSCWAAIVPSQASEYDLKAMDEALNHIHTVYKNRIDTL